MEAFINHMCLRIYLGLVPLNKIVHKNQNYFITYSSLVLLVNQITLMILLEGFLVRLMIGITKNPSRRIINVICLTKRTRLQSHCRAATVDFWQVRPQWWPHHWHAAAATIFYCTKSRQNQGLVGLTSCGGPGSFHLEKNLALKS